ncbi:LysR family transcriptional regulator [Sphingomonas sp.]|uniref:LysR family transcriptional regulator n=1 Tax=Sphingomonas sp. TaxID=28214 RepID=UPI003CC54907
MIPAPYDLNLRHLRALSTVVTSGTVSAAAAVVGLSQPALTQGLRKLEQQLGMALFDRQPDGMTPTAAGTAMAERCTLAFARLAEGLRVGRTGRGVGRPEHRVTATQLDALLRFADAGSFAGAAAGGALSQPAIHRAVRDLEHICGAALALRRGRGMVLTEAGRRVARGVRLAALEIAAGITSASGDRDAVQPIAIGALPLSRALVVPHAVARFIAGEPSAPVSVVEGSWRDLVDPLRDGLIDLMVGALRDEDLSGLDQHPLFDDRLAVVGRAGHPLAGERADVDALAHQAWIVGPAGSPLRARWQQLFAHHDRPRAPIECGSVMVIRGVLADSDLLTLLSPDQVALELTGGVLTRIGGPVAQGLRTIGVTTRSGWRPTAAQARLLSLIREAAAITRVPESE